ncbi:MAG TPA: discoidin domain-containing protein [Pseudonocardiaceae bacterium]|nr:discoidin domain-containing protein [Pseudonocardiaceae bacterium]
MTGDSTGSHRSTDRRTFLRASAALLGTAPLLGALGTPAAAAAAPRSTAAQTLLSQGKTATASSLEAAGYPASNAVDGNTGTRWSSQFSDPQWLQVDLGATATISQITLIWEAAYATAFQLQTSADATNWTTIYSTTTGTGGTQTLAVSGTGRYVRMYGTARATGYGYSLWEFQVYGTSSGSGTSGTPDFGPNVLIFDPTMSSANIQSSLDSVFNSQQSNQFGAQRYALLFKPGTYSAEVNVGFYTHVAGLGASPNDVQINGHVTVDAGWNSGNATENFWRAAENLSVTPSDGTNRWAVAQAGPFRRMHVRGNLDLAPSGEGWSSGGFLSDTVVDNEVTSGSQQQWLSRNDQWGSWAGSVWNMVFVGVVNAPAQNFPNPSHTTVGQTPVVREKPFLYVDGSGNYNVFVPALRRNVTGTTWNGGTAAGSSLPISDFHIVKPGDDAASINAALAQGLNLIITPGVYQIDQTISITRANTVVLGLGVATLVPSNGITTMTVADVDGVSISGLLFDAGTGNSPVLLQIGPSGSSADHSANPTALYDVYARIGGATAGSATVSLQINSNNVICDNLWLWRADHGNGIGWTVNTAANGLIVNGANVTIYGLAVEHYQQYEVVWNGNGGQTYFFQNEHPYDPPSQAAWMNGSTNGYAAYKVASSVTSHQAWGVGSYCYFNQGQNILTERSFEVPDTAGVVFTDLVIVFLSGNGGITHCINETGGPVVSGSNPYYLGHYSNGSSG